jgi:hypothetical protein
VYRLVESKDSDRVNCIIWLGKPRLDAGQLSLAGNNLTTKKMKSATRGESLLANLKGDLLRLYVKGDITAQTYDVAVASLHYEEKAKRSARA